MAQAPGSITYSKDLGIAALQVRVTRYAAGNFSAFLVGASGRVESVGTTEREVVNGVIDGLILILEHSQKREEVKP